MARIRPRERGFSLVELMVALVFTMVLMAGMANVYKASISSFYTSGEALSNVRRNRMTVDLLADDLNTACTYMTDMYIKPSFNPQSPAFYILPNMPVAAAGPNDPPTADELYFFLDQPLAFEGTHVAATGIPAGTATSDGTPMGTFTFTIECGSSTYANSVHKGQYILFKDVWDPAYVTAAPIVAGTQVQVTTGLDSSSLITGTGAYGIPKWPHIFGSGIMIVLPRQMVRYSIQILQLDPGNANGIPCLVRDQGFYNPAGFVADQPQQVITENVSGFKVYLSTNSGATWAGQGAAYTGFANGWDTGIRKEVDDQLAASGRPGVLTTRTDEDWFRDIPTLVRVDDPTRTATQRAEYSAAGNALAYRNLTQSLVFVPRHSGLIWKNSIPGS
jgi:hypothetical protein